MHYLWVAFAQLVVGCDYSGNIGQGFRVGRNPVAVSDHRIFSGIVSGQRKLDVLTEDVEQEAHVTCSGINVFSWRSYAVDAHPLCRFWQYLH